MSSFNSSLIEQKVRQSSRARSIVFAKGVFDVFLSLSIIFFPSVIYDGLPTRLVSQFTGLQFLYRDADPGAAYALAALIMGCAAAGISAGVSNQNSAFKTVAALNGIFAYTGLLGCLFSPKKFGSSVLFLASLQDVVWFFLIIGAGGYSIADTLGWKNAADRFAEATAEGRGEIENRVQRKIEPVEKR